MKYILIFCSAFLHAQVLHREMISSQGISTKTANGLIVKQTIGQQSLTGISTDKELVVMQGFQQSLWGKYLTSTSLDAVDGIKTITYPNPFTETVNFQFSVPIADIISVYVFDILGRLIFQQKKVSASNILTINLAWLPNSEYLVRLNASQLTYYTKIIKQ